jgi:rhodanese-related sulfurtransferase
MRRPATRVRHTSAFHATRGILEFWVDPDSPYYKDVFGEDKTFVFYCQSGWRSALATQTVQRMGLENVCHIGGGYRAWKEAGAPTEELPPR